MADYQLNAQYLRSQIVRDRNQGGLIAWSAYESAQDIPSTKPDAAWVRMRVVAETIPLQSATFVEQTISFFLQDPTTVDNLRTLLSTFNDEQTEVSLSAQIQNIIGYFMPRFSAQTISDAQVQAWYDANGFADAPATATAAAASAAVRARK